MRAKISYEYDEEFQVLIQCPPEGLPKIIEKNKLVWRELGPEDEPYARAIYFGQGRWESLETVSEEEAHRILRRWGYPEKETMR